MKSPEEIKRMIDAGIPPKIDPSQIKFSLGRPLSEEEFKKMCREKNMAPQIHKMDSQKK
jgi:hypothetical protein